MGVLLAKKTGIPAVIAAAVESADTGFQAGAGRAENPAAPAPDGDQLDLLAPAGALTADDAAADKAFAAIARSGRRRGRPPGSRNKKTLAWQDYLIQRYGSPLEQLAAIAAADPADIPAKNLSEALHVKIAAAKALAPYVHSAMPREIKVEGDQVLPALVLNLSPEGFGQQLAGGMLPGFPPEAEIVENQEVSQSDSDGVGQEELDNSQENQ